MQHKLQHKWTTVIAHKTGLVTICHLKKSSSFCRLVFKCVGSLSHKCLALRPIEGIIQRSYLEKVIITPQLYRTQKSFKLPFTQHPQWVQCHFKYLTYNVMVNSRNNALKLILYSFLQMKNQSFQKVK